MQRGRHEVGVCRRAQQLTAGERHLAHAAGHRTLVTGRRSVGAKQESWLVTAGAEGDHRSFGWMCGDHTEQDGDAFLGVAVQSERGVQLSENRRGVRVVEGRMSGKATMRQEAAVTEDGSASARTVLIALAANAVVALAKGAGGAISGSGALMSEAAHSVADTINQIFLLVAVRRSDRPADDEHPFGYGKERFVWSLLAAVGIFVAGAMFSFFEGYRTLTEAPGHAGFSVAYAVLGIAAVLEATSWLRAVRQLRGEARADDQGVIEHIRTSDDPTVKTVASEDSAALIGILIALVGIGLHQLTGDVAFDGVASLLIGTVLVYVAFALGRDSMGLLIGESATPDVRRSLLAELRSFDEVDEVVDLLTMRIGTGRLLVAVRLDFGQRLSSDQIEQISTRIEQRLHARFPRVQELFLDATAATDRDARERRAARKSASSGSIRKCGRPRPSMCG